MLAPRLLTQYFTEKCVQRSQGASRSYEKLQVPEPSCFRTSPATGTQLVNSIAARLQDFQVVDDCPQLDDYVDYWPLSDMLMATLKSSSAKWRKEKWMKAEGVQEVERKWKMEGKSEKKRK